jgi:hypothetical protein
LKHAMKSEARKKAVAFDFVLEELYSLDPRVRPMFGCHAVYVKEKIVLILRRKEHYIEDNGVWLATSREHHDSLKKDLPAMRTLTVFGGAESGWQNLPANSDHFEEEVMKACKLILRGDPRIGKTPKGGVKSIRATK